MVIVRVGPVYGWFTEGFDTLDLKVAKAFCLLFRRQIMGCVKYVSR